LAFAECVLEALPYKGNFPVSLNRAGKPESRNCEFGDLEIGGIWPNLNSSIPKFVDRERQHFMIFLQERTRISQLHY
jgi:hypothetical protein